MINLYFFSKSKRLTQIFTLLLALHCSQYELKAQIFHEPELLSVLLQESVYKVTTADLNGDSLKDVLVSGPKPDVYWFENLGDNEFFVEQEIYEGSVFGESAQPLDMDNDGDLDVICAGSFANKIVWIQNDGDGNFGMVTPILENLLPIDDMILVDLDQDERLDILYSVYSSTEKRGGIYWSKNYTWGFSGYRTIEDKIWGVKKLAVADIDGDDLPDIIGASFWDYRFNWYKNLGDGEFSDAHIIRSQQDTAWNDCAFPADMDGDGDIDIINGNNKTPRVAWLENDGTGVFIAEHSLVQNAIEFVWDADAADFDLDGDMDVFTGLGADEEAALILNKGDGTFEEPIIVGTGITVLNDVHVVDIDGDWDMDVFATSTLDHDVFFFENHLFDCAPVEVHIDTAFCDGESIVIGPLQIKHGGKFLYTEKAATGCDTVFVIQVTEHPAYQVLIQDTIDIGEIYTLPDGEQVSSSGTYTAHLISTTGCDSTIIVDLWVNPVATQEGIPDPSWSILPNPPDEQITISIPQELGHQIVCRFINGTGEVVKQIVLAGGDTTMAIELPAGVYFACLESALHQPVRKITVVKMN